MAKCTHVQIGGSHKTQPIHLVASSLQWERAPVAARILATLDVGGARGPPLITPASPNHCSINNASTEGIEKGTPSLPKHTLHSLGCKLANWVFLTVGCYRVS